MECLVWLTVERTFMGLTLTWPYMEVFILVGPKYPLQCFTLTLSTYTFDTNCICSYKPYHCQTAFDLSPKWLRSGCPKAPHHLQLPALQDSPALASTRTLCQFSTAQDKGHGSNTKKTQPQKNHLDQHLELDQGNSVAKKKKNKQRKTLLLKGQSTQ